LLRETTSRSTPTIVVKPILTAARATWEPLPPRPTMSRRRSKTPGDREGSKEAMSSCVSK
jgi:hypothetical protein